MIGLVIITHGALGREFRTALEHVVGPQKQLETVCVEDEVDRDTLLDDIRRSVKKVNKGDGVVLLTDLFGSTPSNLAIDAMNGASIDMISGINLPMLIAIAKTRTKTDLSHAVHEAKNCGRKYIHVASDLLCRLPRKTPPETTSPAAPKTTSHH